MLHPLVPPGVYSETERRCNRGSAISLVCFCLLNRMANRVHFVHNPQVSFISAAPGFACAGHLVEFPLIVEDENAIRTLLRL